MQALLLFAHRPTGGIIAAENRDHDPGSGPAGRQGEAMRSSVLTIGYLLTYAAATLVGDLGEVGWSWG
jgi:hypothetical protein